MTRAPSDAGVDHVGGVTDMVERVARAIYFAGEGLGPESWFSKSNDAHWAHWWNSEDREYHETQGRAAIEAMREPTPDMVKAGVDLALKVSLGGDYHWPQYLRDVWRTMHAAALRDGEG